MTATQIKSLPTPDPALSGKPEACVQFDRYTRIIEDQDFLAQVHQTWNTGDWTTRERLVNDLETMRLNAAL